MEKSHSNKKAESKLAFQRGLFADLTCKASALKDIGCFHGADTVKRYNLTRMCT